MTELAHAFPLHPEVERLRALLREPSGFGISVALPSRVGADSAQREVLARAAVDGIVERLTAIGVGPDRARSAAGRLEEALAGGRGHGTRVALVTESDLERIELEASLPHRICVGRGLSLRPLLRALALAPPFRVLTVTQNAVRLFASDGLELAELPLGAIPASLEDALGTERTHEELRMRGTQAGGGAPVFYSHGSAGEERKRDRERFEQAVADAVNRRFGRDTTPLVIAAETAHLHGLHGKLQVPGLLAGGVAESPDRLSGDVLRQRAAACVASAAETAEAAAIQALERAHARGKVLDIVDDVAAATVAGRVRRLFVDATQPLPGFVDPGTGRVVASKGDDDVLDSLAAGVLARGGEAHALPAGTIVGGSGVVAELR